MSSSPTIPEVELSHGVKMPVIGLGLAVNPPVAPEVTKQAVLDAIKIGYRHFDTAFLYGTEEALGDAIAEALSSGLISSREELFITSKLWTTDAHPDHVLPAIKKSLKNLKLEYMDLYLIHWPVSSKPGEYGYPIKKEEFMPMDYKGVWTAMEECQKLGLTKAIGVSNFSCKKLSDVLSFAKIPPAVNQVELNPVCQQKKLLEFCKANKIVVTAYSPLGGVGTDSGSNRVFESDVLKEIAKARGKTIAQVCLRWEYEIGITIAVKSFNPERMKQNLEIFDWELSPEDHEKIKSIPHGRVNTGLDYISSYGPFKTVDDIWDGEL